MQSPCGRSSFASVEAGLAQPVRAGTPLFERLSTPLSLRKTRATRWRTGDVVCAPQTFSSPSLRRGCSPPQGFSHPRYAFHAKCLLGVNQLDSGPQWGYLKRIVFLDPQKGSGLRLASTGPFLSRIGGSVVRWLRPEGRRRTAHEDNALLLDTGYPAAVGLFMNNSATRIRIGLGG